MFTESGGIEIARNQERMQELSRGMASAKAWGIEPVSLITPEEVKELVPFINEQLILGGFHPPGAGVVDSLRAGTIMRERAQQAGLTVSAKHGGARDRRGARRGQAHPHHEGRHRHGADCDRRGLLEPAAGPDGGRFSPAVLEGPRDLAWSVGQTVEMKRRGKPTFCCGAGGAHMWMEERGTGIGEERVREAAGTGADTLTVACPFCTVMLDDGVQGTAEGLRVADVATLLAEAIDEPTDSPSPAP